jgi:hypothetical protein
LAIDLPPPDAQSIDKPVILGKLELDDASQCDLTIVYDIEGETPKYELELDSDLQQPRRWTVTMRETSPEPTPIAALELVNGHFEFRWLAESARVPAEKLRNAVLWLQVDKQKQRLQLRKFASPAPVVLDLDSPSLAIGFDAASLPPLELLQLELSEAASLKLPAVEPRSRRVQADKPLRLIAQQGNPGVELRLQLEANDAGAQVRIEPFIVDSDSEPIPLTKARLSSLAREMAADLQKTDTELKKARKRRTDREGDLGRLTQRFGNTNAAANTQMAALRKEIEEARLQEREISKQANRIQRLLSALPGLERTRDQIHNAAKLRVRVFFISGGEEVHLLWM